jgi:hypothetical protein
MPPSSKYAKARSTIVSAGGTLLSGIGEEEETTHQQDGTSHHPFGGLERRRPARVDESLQQMQDRNRSCENHRKRLLSEWAGGEEAGKHRSLAATNHLVGGTKISMLAIMRNSWNDGEQTEKQQSPSARHHRKRRGAGPTFNFRCIS